MKNIYFLIVCFILAITMMALVTKHKAYKIVQFGRLTENGPWIKLSGNSDLFVYEVEFRIIE